MRDRGSTVVRIRHKWVFTVSKVAAAINVAIWHCLPNPFKIFRGTLKVSDLQNFDAGKTFIFDSSPRPGVPFCVPSHEAPCASLPRDEGNVL